MNEDALKNSNNSGVSFEIMQSMRNKYKAILLIFVRSFFCFKKGAFTYSDLAIH